jgi:hypothetical protein
MEELEEIHSRHQLREHKKPIPHPRLRFVLNVIFMVAAIVGVAWYFFADHYTGTIIVLTGMAFKFIELVIRIFKL